MVRAVLGNGRPAATPRRCARRRGVQRRGGHRLVDWRRGPAHVARRRGAGRHRRPSGLPVAGPAPDARSEAGSTA